MNSGEICSAYIQPATENLLLPMDTGYTLRKFRNSPKQFPKAYGLNVHASKRKISLRQTDGLTFPSYQPLFDDFNRSEPKNNGSVHLLKDKLSEAIWNFWDLVGIRVNINYLEDALSCGEEMNIRSIERIGQIELSYEGSDGNTKRALIMAMKR